MLVAKRASDALLALSLRLGGAIGVILDRGGVDISTVAPSEGQEADLPELRVTLLQSQEREFANVSDNIFTEISEQNRLGIGTHHGHVLVDLIGIAVNAVEALLPCLKRGRQSRLPDGAACRVLELLDDLE